VLELLKKTRDWILDTDEQPTVPVYAGYTREQLDSDVTDASERLAIA
jgi:hypothetical protein